MSYEKSDDELVRDSISEYWRIDPMQNETVTTINKTHNMELVKLDKRIREAIDIALAQEHTDLSAAEIVGVLECVKFQLLAEEL